MATQMVVEVMPEVGSGTADAALDAVSLRAYRGVVVKGSQGARWSRDTAGYIIDRAYGLGLHAAWLHYAEPGLNAPTDEAAHMLHTIGSMPLTLGIWVELDDLYGLDQFTVEPWVKEFVTVAHTPNRPLGFVGTPELLGYLSGLPNGVRTIATRPPAEGSTIPWAWRSGHTDLSGIDGRFGVYDLASTRGLIPPDVTWRPMNSREAAAALIPDLDTHEDPAAATEVVDAVVAPPDAPTEDDDADDASSEVAS